MIRAPLIVRSMSEGYVEIMTESMICSPRDKAGRDENGKTEKYWQESTKS